MVCPRCEQTVPTACTEAVDVEKDGEITYEVVCNSYCVIIILPLRSHLIGKVISMLMCWWLAVLVAPIGLLYLAWKKDTGEIELSVSIKRR
jgi:hypothetical protein